MLTKDDSTYVFPLTAAEVPYRLVHARIRKPTTQETVMALVFYGKDPDNPGNNCPAVFRDPSTGDFYFQGETVADPETLTWIAEKSPILDTESVVRLPERMIQIIMEACLGRLQRTSGEV
ncbi:hypothetical protein ACQEVF_20380 [Nonomuraea polychroma]|uniref:hypothetical protein n=1 Tax=Nonomuraea polychroma TaxID=46176 RepID=UPI003D92B533